ncbi:MAG TPA: phage tail protein [Pyrinomonadaceae bacterium]|nr:phage tail protein [Pyrinomonadaceae bacterium]
MSCGGDMLKFRLLDPYVGWDEASCEHLTGLANDDVSGVRLAQAGASASCTAEDPFISAAEILEHIPPPQLARGCGHCDWLLVHESQLLHHDCCTEGWSSVWSKACNQKVLKHAVAVATRGHRIAVADDGAKRVWIWEVDGEQLVSSIDTDDLSGIPECDGYLDKIERVGPIAFTPWSELLVTDVQNHALWRFSAAGELLEPLSISLPPRNESGEIRRLAVSQNYSIWLVTGKDEKSLQLWRAARSDKEFTQGTVKQLRESFKRAGLTAARDEGFCIEKCGPEGIPEPVCFQWNGEPAPKPIPAPEAPDRYGEGKLLTKAIDSGIPRCRWHRLTLDAEVPSGTTLEVAVATGELNREGKHDLPHERDWQVARAGSSDFLINQPPGRYLFVRLIFKGKGAVTPLVRRIKLEFPRVTSLDLLPPIYRENPDAEDFTERFLALFDASIADLDRAIERAPALLDAGGVPDAVLPWLGSFLDLTFDPSWGPELRRKVLRALPDLYRKRGTVAGLKETIKLIFDVTPAIQELATERSWGTVTAKTSDTSLQKLANAQLSRLLGCPTSTNGNVKTTCTEFKNPARLGATRLFGKSRARFRLNTSALNTAPLRSYGNPDHDPLLAQAYRLRILVPALRNADARQKLEQLVASQRPAHTLATIRVGGDRFILGDTSAVGIDTVIAPLPRPVLGSKGNVRLSRASVVWHGKHGTPLGISLGHNSLIGTQKVSA